MFGQERETRKKITVEKNSFCFGDESLLSLVFKTIDYLGPLTACVIATALIKKKRKKEKNVYLQKL